MNHTRQILGSVMLGAAAALTCLFAAPGSAKGDLDIPREFATNASRVETGFLYNSHDSYKFGDFIGVDDERIYWLGNMDLRGRRAFDSDSPIFWRLRASNLGLDSRSVDIEYGQQGKFAFNLDYDEIPKYQIDNAHRYYGGNGGSVMTLPPGWVAADETSGLTELNSNLRDLDIDHKRKNLGVGLSLIPFENWKFTARFDRNLKQGDKLQSALIGSSGGNPRASLVPESIDYDTRNFDANLEYAVDQGQFRLNYHVASFHNRNDSLTFDTPYLCPRGACGGGSWNAAAEWPTGQGRKGLAPDNRFDQLTFSGGYNLPARTRLTMNAAFGRMKQDETFMPYTVNPGLTVATPLPRNSFDGEVKTTALDLRITSRPQPKLSLNASYRYDDRDNKSSTDTYIYVPGDSQDQGAIDSSTARINATEDYKKNELELGARYKLFKRTDLTLEYEPVP
jgi:MtrB/PioB family decaheme-associated outer membrane protein